MEDEHVGPETKRFVGLPRPGVLDLLIPFDITVGERTLVKGSQASLVSTCYDLQEAYEASLAEIDALKNESYAQWGEWMDASDERLAAKLMKRCVKLGHEALDSQPALQIFACPWTRLSELKFRGALLSHRISERKSPLANMTQPAANASELQANQPAPRPEYLPLGSFGAMWRILVQIIIYPTGFADKYGVCDLKGGLTNTPVEAVIKCLLRVHWRGIPTAVAQSDEVDKWLARYNEKVHNANAKIATCNRKIGALNKITESSSSSSTSDVESAVLVPGVREGADSELLQEAQAAQRESARALSILRFELDDAAWFWLLMRRRDIQFSNWGVSLEGPGPEGPFSKR